MRIPGLREWVYLCSPELVQAMLAALPETLADGDIEGFSLVHHRPANLHGPGPRSGGEQDRAGDGHPQGRAEGRPGGDPAGAYYYEPNKALMVMLERRG